MHGNMHPDPVVHLTDTICKSHRLTIRSSYSAETLAAAHGYDDAFPTLVTLVELKRGIITPEQSGTVEKMVDFSGK